MKHTNHTISESDARALIMRVVGARGSQRAAARFFGVSDGYLSDIINGGRKISDHIAQKLGYNKITVYTKQDRGEGLND